MVAPHRADPEPSRKPGVTSSPGDDRLFYAYAQWPDRETWAAEWDLPPEADELSIQMQTAVAERLEPILLTPVYDLLEREGGAS
jgi:hypothetical protein